MKTSKRQFNYFLSALAILASFLIVAPVFAAEIFLKTEVQELKAGQLFEAGVFINTDEESINAIEGKIIFPQNFLEVKKINDGNSIISFWMEKPKIVSAGQIAFSGIVPGGYTDSQGLIFSITFLAKKEGNGAIEFSDIKILRNDGKGTEAHLTVSNFQFSIFKQISSPQIATQKTEDRDPPEKFAPQIVAAPAIFESKWFLVFAAQDKGSGIDHYEVCERQKKCVIAESPHLLLNQRLDSEITVKAMDKNGNERIAVLPPQKSRARHENYSRFIILIMTLAVCAYFARKILWKKRKK